MTDQPVAALLKDLKQRGLLDQTLVVWGGEFGRLPVSKKASPAATTTPTASSCGWPAPASRAAPPTAKPTNSATHTAENPVSVPDFHATVLHLMGLDHEQLTYTHNGRPFRLTDVSGKVIDPILS